MDTVLSLEGVETKLPQHPVTKTAMSCALPLLFLMLTSLPLEPATRPTS